MGQAASRAQTGYTQLQTFYNSSTGLYNDIGWWKTANSLTTIGILASIDTSIQSDVEATIANTYTIITSNSNAYTENQAGNNGGFLNNYLDDEGWWALALIQAYDLTGNTTYLTSAEGIFADMTTYWPTPCYNGGIWWDKSKSYVNAIANELFLSVAANLALRTSGDDQAGYTSWADQSWAWFKQTGMINSQFTINDGLNSSCMNNGEIVWSYNQGVILGGLVALTNLHNDSSYVDYAEYIASAATHSLSTSEGVLIDICDALADGCTGDEQQFKGIFIRNLGVLAQQTGSDYFKEYITNNSDSIWANDLNDGNQLGELWAGPFNAEIYSASTQGSALDCLVQAAKFES